MLKKNRRFDILLVYEDYISRAEKFPKLCLCIRQSRRGAECFVRKKRKRQNQHA